MDEARSVKISVMVTPSLAAKLDDYAEKSRWSRSLAAVALIERALTEQEGS